MKLGNFLASSALIPALAIAAPAVAQTPSGAEEGGIAEIIVTARKTSESLQTTPVAVTAISGESLVNQQIVGIQELQATTPNLTFSSAIAQPGSATVFIRGQGSSDGLIAIDQAVGVYLDGVYAARSTGGATDLFDVQRVEVLRGPQGTLFGRNTTGGAINIIANRPNGKFEGSARVDYGNFNSVLAQGMLNVPLVGDQLAVRVAYQHRAHDGYGFTATLDKPLNDLKSDYGRISVLFAPTGSKFSALISGDFSVFRNSGELIGLKSYSAPNAFAPSELLAAACGTQAIPAGLPAATAGFLGGLKAGAIPLCPALTTRPGPISSYVFGQNGNTNIYRTFGNTPSYGKSDTFGGSAVLEYDFSDAARLKSTTAWRGVRLESRTDNDGTPYTLTGGLPANPAVGYPGAPGNQINQDQFSQELQLSGKISQFEYILGGFYFVENGLDRSDSGSLFPLNSNVATIDGTVRNKSIAGYGQLIFNVTDTLRVTGGLRYTKDDRRLISRNRDTNLLAPPASAVTSSLTGLTDGDPNDPFRATFTSSFSYWSYLASADWQAMQNLFLYAKTSRSQRSGGLNTRAVAGGIPPLSFAPETVTDYEVGAKIDLFDRRIRLNVAAFTSSVDNVQRNLAGTGGTPPRLVGGVANAAKARIRGLEGELTIAPTRGLSFGGSVGYTDAKYNQFLNVFDGNADYSGAKFPYTPEVTLGVFADYSVEVGPGTLKLHSDYSWRSKTYHTALAASNAQRVGRTAAEIAAISNAIQETASLPSYGLLNARIAFELKEPNIELAVYARNITKAQYFTRLLAVENTPLAFTSYMPGDPQTYGVSATFRF